MGQRVESDQLWFKYRKAFIAQIRLKHALRAEDEINEKLHAAKAAFDKQVLRGILPAPPNFAEVVGA